jgi:aconitate hydratase
MTPGTEIGLRIDQTLTQDATGTMIMLRLEMLGVDIGLDRVRRQVSVQYVDQTCSRREELNMTDHVFLLSAT